MQYLAGGAITILKNMKVHGKDYPIYEMENKTCSKPPTRYDMCYIYIGFKSFGLPKHCMLNQNKKVNKNNKTCAKVWKNDASFDSYNIPVDVFYASIIDRIRLRPL